MTAQAIFAIVVGYGRKLGLEIARQDLRRTFAKLAHKGHAAIEEIQSRSAIRQSKRRNVI